jgi:hypothetical protein
VQQHQLTALVVSLLLTPVQVSVLVQVVIEHRHLVQVAQQVLVVHIH